MAIWRNTLKRLMIGLIMALIVTCYMLIIRLPSIIGQRIIVVFTITLLPNERIQFRAFILELDKESAHRTGSIKRDREREMLPACSSPLVAR